MTIIKYSMFNKIVVFIILFQCNIFNFTYKGGDLE